MAGTDIQQCWLHHLYKRYVHLLGNDQLFRQGPWDSVALVVKSGDETRALTKYYDRYEVRDI
jgi:hypothetical protein